MADHASNIRQLKILTSSSLSFSLALFLFLFLFLLGASSATVGYSNDCKHGESLGHMNKTNESLGHMNKTPLKDEKYAYLDTT